MEAALRRVLESYTQKDIEDFKSQLETAQRELDDLRAKHPDWQDEINKIVLGINSDGSVATEQAFEDLDHLIGRSRVALNHAEASSKVARANLLYPFNVAKAAPLLYAAAELAGDNFNYWMLCGRAQVKLGMLSQAQQAFETAKAVAKKRNPQGREYAGVLTDLGDVHVAQGDIPAALIAYQEDLEIAHTLSQQDPRNAEWQQDLAVSRAKMTMIDAENVRDHWAKVVEILSDMQSRGVLLPGDVHKLEYARDQLGLD